MSFKIKAGMTFSLPVEIDDEDFENIAGIEFIFKQEADDDEANALKTAYWSKDGLSRNCAKVDGQQTILVRFSRADTYLFEQGEDFFMDTRIHYEDTDENPFTNIVRLRMENSLFEQGEEATPYA